MYIDLAFGVFKLADCLVHRPYLLLSIYTRSQLKVGHEAM